MSVKRARTESAYEETNVSSFVESCVGYHSNVTFHSASEAGEGAGAVLLMGTAEELRAEGVRSLPFFGEEVRAAVETLHGGEGVYATSCRGRRVLVGCVPSVASRHNCPARPDVMTSLVEQAVKEPSAKRGLDVYVRSEAYVAAASAIARAAGKRFTAKSGSAEKGYTGECIAVRVYFCAEIGSKKAGLGVIADCVQLCQRLVDAPTNLLDTTTFTEIACRYAESCGFSADVIRGEALREAGYGGLYGVGKAAEFPPALVSLTYRGKEGISPRQKLAWVGKGIVYDTGGLAIKTPTTVMCGMKADMGGAAAVFCSFLAAVRLGVAAELGCVLCLADNAVGPRSQRNDDIVRLRSGVTCEINNTDAEGRLVLSDGVYHASALLPFRPDVIVDMATLTGAQGIATGKRHAAIFTNNEEYETRTLAAGRRSGDLCFPVVYAPEFHNPEFSSTVADHRNSVRDRANAQVSCAGQFVGNNLSKDWHGAWVHVDLAAPAMKDSLATGFGVALNVELFFPEHI